MQKDLSLQRVFSQQPATSNEVQSCIPYLAPTKFGANKCFGANKQLAPNMFLAPNVSAPNKFTFVVFHS